jgi:hypothetical protein
MIGPAREDEQEIAQSIQKTDQARLDRLRQMQRHQSTLGAATDGTTPMELRAQMGAAGKDEACERGKIGLVSIDGGFQRFHLLVGDPLERSEAGVVAASSAPIAKSWVWSAVIGSVSHPSRSRADAAPSAALSSSTLPYASTRAEDLSTRPGPSNPVVPSSPVRV